MGKDEYPVFTPYGKAAIFDETRTWVDPRGYRLSGRLWNARALDSKAIDSVLLEGLASGRAALAVAKDLEIFLTPEGASSKTRHPVGRGSGNAAARRLARTETSHSFSAANLQADTANPFVEGSQWNRSSAHVEADICDENAAGHSPGMGPGQYLTTSFPRMPAHPNCMCFTTSVLGDQEAALRQLEQGLDPNNLNVASIQPLTHDSPLSAFFQRAILDESADEWVAANIVPEVKEITEAVTLQSWLEFSAEYSRMMSVDQAWVGFERLNPRMVERYLERGRGKQVMALRKDGQLYILDGEETIAAARLGGWSEVEVNLYDLDALEALPEFRGLEEAEAFDRLHSLSQQWAAGLSETERASISSYQNGGYHEINGFLRRSREVKQELVQDRIEGLDIAMNRFRTPEPVKTYRAVSRRDMLHSENSPELGMEIMDLGYGSTTTRHAATDEYVQRASEGVLREVVEIRVPANHPSMYLTSFGAPGEAELLLPRGQHYRVVGRNSRGELVLEALTWTPGS